MQHKHSIGPSYWALYPVIPGAYMYSLIHLFLILIVYSLYTNHTVVIVKPIAFSTTNIWILWILWVLYSDDVVRKAFLVTIVKNLVFSLNLHHPYSTPWPTFSKKRDRISLCSVNTILLITITTQVPSDVNDPWKKFFGTDCVRCDDRKLKRLLSLNCCLNSLKSTIWLESSNSSNLVAQHDTKKITNRRSIVGFSWEKSWCDVPLNICIAATNLPPLSQMKSKVAHFS